MIIVACRKLCLEHEVRAKEGSGRRSEFRVVRRGLSTNQWMVIDIEVSKQLLRSIQERGGGVRVQKTRYDQVPMDAISSRRIYYRVERLTHLDRTAADGEVSVQSSGA